MFLDEKMFSQVIENAPLVSIDLIIRNLQGDILLGKRTNPPAQGYWFILGGRLYKNESIEQAFLRITKQEFGYSILLNQANFFGVYQHFYNDSIFCRDISTHYIVLAYELVFTHYELSSLPLLQHSQYIWIPVKDLLIDNNVHNFTKAYF